MPHAISFSASSPVDGEAPALLLAEEQVAGLVPLLLALLLGEVASERLLDHPREAIKPALPDVLQLEQLQHSRHSEVTMTREVTEKAKLANVPV